MIIQNIYINNGFIPTESGHIIKISDSIWLEICEYGYGTLKTKTTNSNIRNLQDLGHIPKPVRTHQEVKDLLDSLKGIKLETV